ncbi:hypothetical protein Leryth_026627 [Lithospermum erythrorhizon]|nr:hypothetical protein Leryth_026627 [Lithospermum erythrorhizon]
MSLHDEHPFDGDFCPINVDYNSPGLFDPLRASNFLSYDLPRIHFQLVIIFLLTYPLHMLLKKIHLPRIASQILVGIMLGPSILGRIGDLEGKVFPDNGDIFLSYLSRIGYIFFIFLWGVKMDSKMVVRAGWRGWIVGISGGLLPLIIGQAVFLEHVGSLLQKDMLGKVISTQCFISFPVVASILVDLKIINTELGHVALASSLVSNFIDISTSIVSTSIRSWTDAIRKTMMAQSFSLFGMFLLFSVVFVKPLSHRMIRQTPKGKQVKPVFIVVMCIMLLVSCLFADNIALNHEVGAFIIGLAVPDGPPLGSSLVEKLETLVDGLLIPLMIAYCGTKVDLTHLADPDFIRSMWILIILSLGSQLLSIFIPALCFKMPPRDALALSFILSSQGIVQIATHLFLFNSEVFDKETFSMMILSVLVIASSMDTLARLTYNYSFTYAGYQKRTIQHEGLNGELKILACIYHFDDVYSTKKLLEASIPDEKSPVSVAVIHLEELVGRANPQLIDHKVGQSATFSSGSRSQEVFEFFTSFEHQYIGSVNVHLFTGLSMLKFMHQDICGLAFKKSVSLIILPFHRKWNHQGKVISDNNSLRMVNRRVIELAPSSVGILIDRQKVQRSSTAVPSIYRVVVIFIGGADDREALFYGKRMARSHRVHLTLVRLIAPHMYTGENQWDNIMDSEALKQFKVHAYGNIEIRDETVKDGADTTHLVHEIEEAFDLILVGRSHNENLPQLSGLSEFTEFPELGSVGDITANSDITSPLSILVLQQQIKKS